MTTHILACAAPALINRGPLETRADPDDDPLLLATQAVEELRTGFAEFRTGSEATITELRKKIVDLETRANRPNGRNLPEEISIERRAFANYLRFGDNNPRHQLDADEVRALVVGDDPRGGYVAPAEFQAEVIKNIQLISPIRQVCRVGSTAAGSVILPKLTGRPTASWVGEEETRPETTESYGQIEIPIHEVACYIDVSTRLLEDAAINIETEIAADLAVEFDSKEGGAFSIGNGVKKPLGFQMAAGVGQVSSGDAVFIRPDGLVALLYTLPEPYRSNGVFVMNGKTLGAVRTFKDNQGNYIWSAGNFTAGQPQTILGRPILEDPTMPDIGPGSFPVAYGDFSRAYRIYDRVNMEILRDPFTQATRNKIRYHARRRVGGGPVLVEALRKLVVSV